MQMKTGIIRWWGLGVFVVLVAAMGLLWLLVVDGLVKATIEEEGTALVGAKVELDAADLTLLPSGLTLTRLQITNPDDPMTNMVEIARLTATLDGLQLLRRKVIIDDMRVEGVQFGTARATSGAISDHVGTGKPSEAKEESFLTIPPFEVPDVQRILEEEDLETLKLIRAIQTDIQRERELWKQRLETLPGKEEFAKYRKRIEALKGAAKGGVGGILGGAEELKRIKQDIEQDLTNLKSARQEFDKKIALLNQRIAQVQHAPQRDVRRLKEKYSLSPQGLANLGQTLLGNQLGATLKELVGWYEMAQPYFDGMKTSGVPAGEDAAPTRRAGQDIRFKEFEPLPEFLIREARASLLLDMGRLEGTVQNLTPDQATLGAPLTYVFAGEQLKDLQHVSIEGVLDYRDLDQPKATMELRAKGYRLQAVPLSAQPDWPVTVEQGLADVSVAAELRGQAITATVNAELSSLRVSAGNPGDANPLTKALSGAVSGISTLSVQADVRGTLQQYDVQVHSELDRLLEDAAGKIVKNLAANFSQNLQAAISAKVADPLESLTGSLSGLDSIGGELATRLTKETKLLQGLLQQGFPPKILPKGLPEKLPGNFQLPF